jgi:hypothetical protein
MLNWLHGPVTCEAQTGTCIVNIVIAAFVSSNAQAEMIDGQKRRQVGMFLLSVAFLLCLLAVLSSSVWGLPQS